MLPSECNMPDVSDLLASPAQKPFLIHQLLGAELDFPEKMLAYRRNFVRLADKAARDYADVRRCVVSLIQQQKSGTLEMEGGRLLVSFSTDRLEDCIITVRRLFKYFERIKSDQTQFPLDRLFKKRVETLETSISDVRDLIVHLDNDIYEGRIAAGQAIAPNIDENTTTITLGASTLSVESLARAIRHFHNFARTFAEHHFLPAGTYEQMPRSGPVKGQR
jgi:hypothetical protein